MQICKYALGMGALGLAMSSGAASAAVLDGIALEQGRYQLCNHPDGNSRPPGYGLILTELYDVTGGDDQFNFDFEHPDSDMVLSWDGTKITIQGDVFGGRDVGTDWANDIYKGVYHVFFEYQVASKAPGDDDLWVPGENAGDVGTILTPLGDTINLSSKSNGDYAFRLGDEDNDLGHRGFDGISGWGWINHANRQDPSDWLFTLKPIPTPGTVVLAMMAVPFMGVRRRRA